MSGILLLADPRVAAVPVAECGEPLADLGALGFRLDPRHADPAGAFARFRRGNAERLLAARAALPEGVDLLVVEAFRPAALQRAYYEEHRAELRALQPGWDEDHLRAQTSRYISPPEVAPHVCGAAIDLTLCDGDGRELDLGTRVNASPVESDGRCFTDAPDLAPGARANRAVLVAAMTAAGFLNYPTEWWHWQHGDRYWAAVTGAPAARYGPLDR